MDEEELEGSQPGSVPPFLRKTFDLVESSSGEVIGWSATGKSFIVYDPEKLAKEVLGTVFKHSNFASFVRQLNTYSFSKIDPQRWEFSNPYFMRGRRDLLGHIKRKKSTPREGGPNAQATPAAAPLTKQPSRGAIPVQQGGALVGTADPAAYPQVAASVPPLFAPPANPPALASSPGAPHLLFESMPGSAFMRVRGPQGPAIQSSGDEPNTTQGGLGSDNSSGTAHHRAAGSHETPGPSPHTHLPLGAAAAAVPAAGAFPPSEPRMLALQVTAGAQPAPLPPEVSPGGGRLALGAGAGAGPGVDPSLFRPQPLPLSVLSAMEADRMESEEKHRKMTMDMEFRLQAHFDSRIESMAKCFEDRLQAERDAFQQEREQMRQMIRDLSSHQNALRPESQLALGDVVAPDLVSEAAFQRRGGGGPSPRGEEGGESTPMDE